MGRRKPFRNPHFSSELGASCAEGAMTSEHRFLIRMMMGRRKNCLCAYPISFKLCAPRLRHSDSRRARPRSFASWSVCYWSAESSLPLRSIFISPMGEEFFSQHRPGAPARHLFARGANGGRRILSSSDLLGGDTTFRFLLGWKC